MGSWDLAPVGFMVTILFLGCLGGSPLSQESKDYAMEVATPSPDYGPSPGSAETEFFQEEAVQPMEKRALTTGADEGMGEGVREDITGQKVIYSGTIELEVEDFDFSLSQVKSLVESYGGFISDSNIFTTPAGKKRGVVTVRVPQENFQEVIDGVSLLGTVETITTRSQDVTLEYTDLNSRLSNLQRQEKRLLELLDRAGNISEILAVEKEIERVRGEIERIQGRLNYLENKIDLSTLVITLHEPEPIETKPVQFWANMEVKDLDTTFKEIDALARDSGGYISSARIDESDPAARRGEIQVDIPQNRFNDMSESLKGLGRISNQKLEGIPRDDASPASRAYLYLQITERPSIVRQVMNQDYGIDDSIRRAVRGFVQTLKTLIEAIGLFLPTAILALVGYLILKAVIKEGLKKYLMGYLALLSLLSIESGGGVLLALLIGYILYDLLARRGKEG
jgi:hypothetical protein